jgi:hypothetical protein
LIGVFVKEYVYLDYDYYVWIYVAINVVGLILIVAGLVYAVLNSTIVWYVWAALGLALILSIIGNMLAAIIPSDFVYSCSISIVAFFIWVIVLILLIGNGPIAINLDLTLNNMFWFFPFLCLVIIFGILSVIFEGYSTNPCCPQMPCCVENPCGLTTCNKCNICDPIIQNPCCTVTNPCGLETCTACVPYKIKCCNENPCHQSTCSICNKI